MTAEGLCQCYSNIEQISFKLHAKIHITLRRCFKIKKSNELTALTAISAIDPLPQTGQHLDEYFSEYALIIPGRGNDYHFS